MTERRDRAIRAALVAAYAKSGNANSHTFAQALIRDLTDDMFWPDSAENSLWNLCLEAIRTRVGIGCDTPAPITPERVLLNECVQAAALAGCESPGAPSAPAIQAMVRVLTKGLSGPEVRAVLHRAGIGGE
jgi:hypothetical protein